MTVTPAADHALILTFLDAMRTAIFFFVPHSSARLAGDVATMSTEKRAEQSANAAPLGASASVSFVRTRNKPPRWFRRIGEMSGKLTGLTLALISSPTVLSRPQFEMRERALRAR